MGIVMGQVNPITGRSNPIENFDKNLKLGVDIDDTYGIIKERDNDHTPLRKDLDSVGKKRVHKAPRDCSGCS